MKPYIIFLIFGSIFIFVLFERIFISRKLSNVINHITILEEDTPKSSIPPILLAPTAYPSIQLKAGTVSYALEVIDTIQNISLIPNFTEKSTASGVKENQLCETLSSAGFYTTEDKPIGLYSIEHNQFAPKSDNLLFNGFVYSKEGTDIEISVDPPAVKTAFTFQTGPILFSDSAILMLNINNDEEARRIILVKTEDKSTILIALFLTENSFTGPLLGDVPKILQTIAETEKISIAYAINLDGGSHSAFISESVSLGELLPVGSFLCIK